MTGEQLTMRPIKIEVARSELRKRPGKVIGKIVRRAERKLRSELWEALSKCDPRPGDIIAVTYEVEIKAADPGRGKP